MAMHATFPVGQNRDWCYIWRPLARQINQLSIECDLIRNRKGEQMNYSRLVLAAFGGMVASFAVGALVFWLVPALVKEGHKYPAVFRPKEEMMKVMPVGIVATFISILVVTLIFAMLLHGASGAKEGARFGVLIGIFVVCAFVLHNYVNLNIGLKLALGQAVAYFVQWTIVGIVIGLIYKPLATP
jgi:hypothetical protein